MKYAIILTFLAASVLSPACCQSESECNEALMQKSKEAANKALVLEFYQKLFGDHDFDAIYEYLGDPYIQHNPLLADGRESLRAEVPKWLKDAPKGKLDIRRTAAEGDLVWVHLKMNFLGSIQSLMDIFRVENGKIVEHWDAIQRVPENSANNNTMF